MTRAILDPYSEFDNIVIDLTSTIKSIDKDKNLLTGIEFRNVPQDMKVGLDYLKISFKTHVTNLRVLELEAVIADCGLKYLIGKQFLRDLENTWIILMGNPNVKETKRFRADSNKITNYEFLQPYYTAKPRWHGILKTTAGTLGHLTNQTHLEFKFLYSICELYGQLHFMDSLDEIPNKAIYAGHQAEIELFENEVMEELDIMKLRYKLYDVGKDGRKVLQNFDAIDVKGESVEDYGY